MKDSPKFLFIDHAQSKTCFVCSSQKHVCPTPKYVSMDLVEKLIGYAEHKSTCDLLYENRNGDEVCTCGLTKLIAEIRGE